MIFTGSPWFLFLLLPGFALIYWQYVTRDKVIALHWPSFIAITQILALMLLVLALWGPVYLMRSTKFVSPRIIIAVDQSASFAGGETLRQKIAVDSARLALEKAYRDQGFIVSEIQFGEKAMVSSSKNNLHMNPIKGAELTDFSALASLLDSLNLKNVQGLFLFSDGQVTLQTKPRNLEELQWPIFPLIIASPIHEAQLEKAEIRMQPSQQLFLDIAWKRLGTGLGPWQLDLCSEGKVLFSKSIQHFAVRLAAQQETFALVGGSNLKNAKALTAVFKPVKVQDNIDLWNDSLSVNFESNNQVTKLFFLSPIKSLSEKAVLDLLRSQKHFAVEVISPETLSTHHFNVTDEIWVSASLWQTNSKAFLALGGSAQWVVYSDEKQMNRAENSLALFSQAASICPLVNKESYPLDASIWKTLSTQVVKAPRFDSNWDTFLLIHENQFSKQDVEQGVLAGRLVNGANADQVLFCVWPDFWQSLFTEQPDYTKEENLKAYLNFISQVALWKSNAYQIKLPNSFYADLPFSVDINLPPKQAKSNTSDGKMIFEVLAEGDSMNFKSYEITNLSRGSAMVSQVNLKAGKYVLRLQEIHDQGDKASDKKNIWSQNIQVFPREKLEWTSIGYNLPQLQKWADARTGKILWVNGDGETLALPFLPNAQMKENQDRQIGLTNTLPWFCILLGLLTCSWLLRKRIRLD